MVGSIVFGRVRILGNLILNTDDLLEVVDLVLKDALQLGNATTIRSMGGGLLDIIMLGILLNEVLLVHLMLWLLMWLP